MGRLLRRPSPAVLKPAGNFTSSPQGWPVCQPALARKLAVEARASAVLSIRSRLPSPSPSTARRSKVLGMNCVWPKAPAQLPTSRSGAMSPDCRMRSVAKNSPRKKAWRRPKHDSVPSACTSGWLPKLRPKLLSTPQTATTVAASTP